MKGTKRAGKVCDHCRNRKTRCLPGKKGCLACSARKQPCSFSPATSKKRGPYKRKASNAWEKGVLVWNSAPTTEKPARPLSSSTSPVQKRAVPVDRSLEGVLASRASELTAPESQQLLAILTSSAPAITVLRQRLIALVKSAEGLAFRLVVNTLIGQRLLQTAVEDHYSGMAPRLLDEAFAYYTGATELYEHLEPMPKESDDAIGSLLDNAKFLSLFFAC